MSAPTKQTAARRPAPATGKSRVTQYVDQQLEKTRRQVKSTDLIASILLLVVMVIGFLLLAAILDAWVITFTPLMRWSALLLLVTGCVVTMVFSIWPLLTKQINPDYAAKMLEDSKPGFRNSVLNYVWFRKKPDSIRSAVFDAVARQAAVDLNSVPVDSSVDRSKVIRLGFWLVAMTAAFIAYFMLSPKNPLQTLNRVLFPSADLAKPAVVTIADVTPGNASVFFGDQIEITAKVYGPHSPEEVKLIYSTNDGRQSGQVRLMQPDPTTPRQYILDLTENTGGLRESLEYEIVARDGQSGKFEIKVAPRPAITIESIQIDPPKYTKLKPQMTLQGAIEGVEGAKVTVNATANLEIESATIELLNQLPTLPNEDQKFKLARAPVSMTVDSKNATAVFQLTLDTNREKPIATHYRINFNSVDGNSPAVPNIYSIRTIPDLAPELEIRAPATAESKVAANGNLNVAATANDLDYEISFVRIHIEHRGNQVLNKTLTLKTQANNQRKVQARYKITPEELGLTTGDQAIFYITAEDNRTSYYSDTDPEPNVTRSKNYSFTVTAPKAPKDGQQDKQKTEPNPPPQNDESADDPKDPSGNESDTGEQSDPSEQGTEGSQQQDTPGAEDNNDPSRSTDGSREDNQDPGNESSDNPQPDDQNSSDSQTDESPDGNSSDGNKGSSAQSENPSGEDNTTDSPPNDGGTGGDEQTPEQPSPTGNGGSESDTDGGDPNNKSDGPGSGQRPSDSDPNSDASNARSGNNPTGNNTVNDSAPERKDEDLTEGDEQLSSDASGGEKVRRLQELLGDDPDQQEQEGDPDQPNNQESSDSSENSEQSPNDPTNKPGNEDQNPNQSDNSPSTQQSQGGTEPDQQNTAPENSQNSRPQNDSAEGNPREQDPSDQSESNPSGESEKPNAGPSESEQPSSGNPSNGSEPQNSDDSPSGDTPSGEQSSGEQSNGSPSESGKPGETSPGQGTQGQKSTGQPQEGGPEGQSSGTPSSGESEGTGQSQQSSNDTQSDGSATPKGGGQAGSGDVGSDALIQEKENLEHSKKAIDLLLNKLRNQRHNPDPELLKKMGWNKQNLNDFIDSHEQMKEAAARGDAQARRKYDRLVESYGLRPNDKRRSVAGNQEKAGQVIQDGVVNEAPPEEYHNFNSFLQDLQRARQ